MIKLPMVTRPAMPRDWESRTASGPARCGPDQRVLRLARDGARRPGGAARPGRSSAAGPLLRPAQAHADQSPDCHSPRQVGWVRPLTTGYEQSSR